ncbi:hypothetical protein SDC9_190712 [bioreactor metagenome]|uniref:Uncharacterized protein n=1 Tax=bioreactor metagenome TaxID=1076179 RepID=A0A645I6S4_9ZZZZ
MEHHRVVAQLLQGIELPIEGLSRASCRAVRILALADVPRAEAELVLLGFRHIAEELIATTKKENKNVPDGSQRSQEEACPAVS